MRSIKSELYLFIKSVILGGDYTDNAGTEFEFTGVLFNGNHVNNYMFYNGLLNEYPFISVLFRFENIDPNIHYLKTGSTDSPASIQETVRFSLFVPYPKETSEMLENDYLDHLDLCELIHYEVSGKYFNGCSTIVKSGETSDDESKVIMGKEMMFDCVLQTVGMTSNVDANDDTINPEAPVVVTVSPIIVKKVS